MLNYEAPRQVIVLGGGLTPDGQATQETAERTLSAVYYSGIHDANRIIFSGGRGFLADGLAEDIAEADVMADIAVNQGLNPDYVVGIDRQSRSTFETFLNVKSMLDDQKTAIITHAYHLPRALKMASLVLPMQVVGYEAFAEYNGKTRAPASERVLRIVTNIAMHGIESGDDEALRQRNDKLAQIVATPGRLKLLKATLLRNHTSIRATKASGLAEKRE